MVFKLGKNKVKKIYEYKYCPKNSEELQEILEERLKKIKMPMWVGICAAI